MMIKIAPQKIGYYLSWSYCAALIVVPLILLISNPTSFLKYIVDSTEFLVVSMYCLGGGCSGGAISLPLLLTAGLLLPMTGLVFFTAIKYTLTQQYEKVLAFSCLPMCTYTGLLHFVVIPAIMSA